MTFQHHFAIIYIVPARQERYAGVAHLVERNLAKVEVAGSSPVTRSNKKSPLSIDKGDFLFYILPLWQNIS